MPEFPDSFNPSIDRYDRRSAARLFRWLWPAAEVSLECVGALAASIRVAHEIADACWSVTMFPHGFRLNVGQVEVLTLAADKARFVFKAPLSADDALPGEVEIGSEPYYQAVPVPSGVCIVAAEKLSSFPSFARDSHHAFIRNAAALKRRSPFRNAFSPAVLEYLEAVLGEALPRPSYVSEHGAMPRVEAFPEELDASMPIREGTAYQVIVNAFERNPVARSRCIAYYTATCVVCGFSFGSVYGPLAEGFIHVHHIKPLSAIGEEYEVDPIEDLRPVCPNCHAVIHLNGGCLSIAEVKELLATATKPGIEKLDL